MRVGTPRVKLQTHPRQTQRSLVTVAGVLVVHSNGPLLVALEYLPTLRQAQRLYVQAAVDGVVTAAVPISFRSTHAIAQSRWRPVITPRKRAMWQYRHRPPAATDGMLTCSTPLGTDARVEAHEHVDTEASTLWRANP